MSVTTTSGKVGKFETRFFQLVYEEEFGCVKGHFGPINACKLNYVCMYVYCKQKGKGREKLEKKGSDEQQPTTTTTVYKKMIRSKPHLSLFFVAFSYLPLSTISFFFL